MKDIPSPDSRLGRALSMLPRSDTLIDVGCDHGRLCLAVLASGKAARAVGTDISAASLGKATRLFEHRGLNACFIEADGIAMLDVSACGEYALCICGMGGELIASILESGETVARAARAIVMQPMGGTGELRRWLCENGYHITDESTVRDAGRYYQLICAQFAPQYADAYTDEALLEFGATGYAKREQALYELLVKTRASRRKRMERARKNGVVPPNLMRELEGVERLIANWEA